MFFVDFLNEMGAFIVANPQLVAVVMAVMEYLKQWLVAFPWFVGGVRTLAAFIVGFLFAMPSSFVGMDWPAFIAHGIALGGVASGLYKLGETVATKIGVAANTK